MARGQQNPTAEERRTQRAQRLTKKDQDEFIAKVAPLAQASQEKYGVPASVTIAQAMVESADAKGNWGRSPLAYEDNNYFGIKARQGEDYCQHPTKEWCKTHKRLEATRAPFRKFRWLRECFDRHAELLAKLPRYQPAMAVADDPLAFALQLKLCGYATDPNYPTMLASKIRTYKLAEYDNHRVIG